MAPKTKKSKKKDRKIPLGIKEFLKELMKPISPSPRLPSGNKNTRKLLKEVDKS